MVSYGTIDQLANKLQYIFCKTGLSQGALSPKVPQSPLYLTLRSHGRVKMTYIGAYSRPIINIIRLYDVIKDIKQSALYLNFKS